MGLRDFFGKRPAAAGTSDSFAVLDTPQLQEPLTPEQLADLQQAWAELAQAAEGSDLISLHACSRNGKRWEEDPVAVRGPAATLREFRAEGTAAETQET
ncbi:hypothetical protein [Paenarthrobacter sp. YJN-D]|uniref:hypothetical protein n=1 Tax=Paenarthrobacter sp. YJN-D TaxID=2735317 RepID=UPI00187758EB|nr:hypothetical protein [Paenarthrobacter sp. YJN-D]QOT24082.1 hypothetical protein HMI60_20875 [Paenarthrobacter sp. YJN-D]